MIVLKIGRSAAWQNVLSSFYKGKLSIDVFILIIELAAGAAVVYFIANLKQKSSFVSKDAFALKEAELQTFYGDALYVKVVGFVENLEKVGEHLDRSRKSYDEAFKQLKDGRGSLIGQAESLPKLGVKAKKSLPTSLLNESDGDDNESPSEPPIVGVE